MKIYTAILTTAAAAVAAPAIGQSYTTSSEAEVVERNAQGKATKVRVDGTIYEVCMSQNQDSCINPRAAGLNWGDVPLGYWPGKPASTK
jgi:hypothetical protein